MGTKNALTEKVYSGKDIMRIAYPIVSTQFRASPFERALFSALNRVSLKN